MGLLRKDYILDRWVYYAVSRKKRPHEFKAVESKSESGLCVFCPGNEKLTPPEIGRVEYKNGWKLRWFLNKYAAIDYKSPQKLRLKKYFAETGTYGIHEIIVESQHHKSQLADLPSGQIKELLEVCRLRIHELSKIQGINYVQIFKNHGKDAGTSLVHSHTQVTALGRVPELVMEESKANGKKCAYCNIIKTESKSKRKIFETKNITAIAPFASRFNYEAWIFPKKHKKNINELADNELNDMAAILKKILLKLKSINASYNFLLHYSPAKENLHFHIEIAPRIATWGGFELSTDFIINSVLPEDAARFYKSKR